MRRRTWMVLLLLVVALAAGALWMGRSRTATTATEPAVAPAVPVEVARVTVGTVARTVEVSGTLIAPTSAEVFPKIGGRVARVLAQDGQRVGAGQALIQLDASDQRQDLRQAEAAVAAAEARLKLVQTGQRPQERQVVFNAFTQAQNQVKAAETQVTVSQATLRVAEDNLRRQEQLLREGAVAQAQVDQARLQVDQARAQLQAAQTQLEIAKTAVDSARQQWDMTVTGAREEEVRAARAQVAQARAVAGQARQRLAAMTVRAPFAGRVTGLSVSPGDFVVSGDFAARGGPIATVYDDRIIEAEVRVGERDLALVRLGQPALLRLEANPGAPLPANVALLSPAADPGSRAATARLRLRQVPAGIAPGTFARGEIVVERRAGVLLVPAVAVTGGGEPVVRVVVDGSVQVRPVTLGLGQGTMVEIKTGVAAEELVVTLGPENLPAGTIVQVVGVTR